MTKVPPVFHVYLRRADRSLIDRLDIWTKLTFIKRFNRTGTWSLEIPKSSKLARQITNSTGIIITRDGIPIFSGPQGFSEEAYVATKNTLMISGVDDNIVLEEITRPTPSLSEAPYPDEYDVTTGIASSIMRSLVMRNIGELAPADCQISGLVMQTDPLLGNVITARSRFDPLIILLAELASTPIATGLGFDIVQQNIHQPEITFSIYEPEDKHIEVVFGTELHTAQDYEHIHSTPGANYFIVAGGGDYGEDRPIVEGGDADNIAAVGRRISRFIDKRGVTDTSELEQALAEKLATVVTVDTINVLPTDTASLKYGTDYNLGDYVSVAVEGVNYPRIIREVTHTNNPGSGWEIVPTIADPSGTNDTILSQQLYTLQNRISNIERNFNVPDNSITGDMIHETQRWYVGDVKLTARGAAQPGWLLCLGTAISRSQYAVLFSQIGTLFGVGNGSTTFNIPDWRDRFPMGAGGAKTRGDTTDGSASFSHSHTHSHGGGTLHYTHYHASQAHTHPGSHKHGLAIHRHEVDISHDHPSQLSGKETNYGTDTFGRTAGSTTGNGHQHNVDLTSLSVSVNSGNGAKTTGGSSFNETDLDGDTGALAASYSGNPSQETEGTYGGSSVAWSGGSDPDSTSTGSSFTMVPASQAINYEIYTGVVV